jgi:hypothetical protein
MNSQVKRERVYYSWVVYRHLTFDLKRIGRLINGNDIRLTLIAGKYDKVIRPENMRRLLKHVRHHRFEILESGHTGLITAALHLLTGDP